MFAKPALLHKPINLTYVAVCLLDIYVHCGAIHAFTHVSSLLLLINTYRCMQIHTYAHKQNKKTHRGSREQGVPEKENREQGGYFSQSSQTDSQVRKGRVFVSAHVSVQ